MIAGKILGIRFEQAPHPLLDLSPKMFGYDRIGITQVFHDIHPVRIDQDTRYIVF